MRWFPLSLRPSPLPFTDQGSAPGPPYAVPSLFEIGILITGFSESGIRGLWLGAFGKAGLFRCQSAFAISFCLRHCISLCKGTKAPEFGLRRILGWFAGFFMEESCRGFFASNWLCSKPGRSLCERIKLTFATAPGCLHSLSLGRHDRFGCLCNPGLLKNCVFLCKGKKLKNSAKQNSWRVCRFSPWNLARCFRIQRKRDP